MKCRVEVECTPLEARQFFGLPDLQPMQATIMAEVEKKLLAEMDRFSPDSLLKNWFSLYSQTPEQVQDFLTKMMRNSTGVKTS
jgi:hypothetical protein